MLDKDQLDLRKGDPVLVVKDAWWGKGLGMLRGESAIYVGPTGDRWYPHRIKHGVEEFVVAEVRREDVTL